MSQLWPSVSPCYAKGLSWIPSLHRGPHGVPLQLGVLVTTSELAVNLAGATVVTDVVVTPGGHANKNPDREDEDPGHHDKDSGPWSWKEHSLEEVREDAEPHEIDKMDRLASAVFDHDIPPLAPTDVYTATVGWVGTDGVDGSQV